MADEQDTPSGDQPTPPKPALDPSFAAYLAIGIGVGTALGVSFDNIGLGIGIGVAIGTALGLAVNASRAKKSGGDGDEPDA